jgi:hypothetical protein
MTVREYISDLLVRIENMLDWFLDGARLLGNFQWLDLTMPQAFFTCIFFFIIFTATRGEDFRRYSNYSDDSNNEGYYLEAKNLVELNMKFFLGTLFNMFSALFLAFVIFALLFDDVNYSAMFLWVFISWALLGIGAYNRRVKLIKGRESLIEEYESKAGIVEEFGEEQESEK